MGPPGSCCDDSPGAQRTPTEVLDCPMVGLGAARIVLKIWSPDRRPHYASQTYVPCSKRARANGNGLWTGGNIPPARQLKPRERYPGRRVPGPALASQMPAPRKGFAGYWRYLDPGDRSNLNKANGVDLCPKYVIEGPPRRKSEEATSRGTPKKVIPRDKYKTRSRGLSFVCAGPMRFG